MSAWSVYVAVFLVLALWVIRLYRRPQQALGLTAALFGIYLVLALMPIQQVGVVGLIYGAVGDPSLTSVILLTSALYGHLGPQPLLTTATRKTLIYGVALAATLLYPLALGLSSFDAYRLGYQPWLLSTLLLVLALWNWRRGQRQLAWILALLLAGFALRLLPSNNLWDYVLDPWVALYAWGSIVRRLIPSRLGTQS